MTSAAYTIEPANWRDLGGLRHMEKLCFPKDAWPLWDLIGVLTLPGVVRIKAMIDGQMVGFIAGDVRRTEGVGWVATVGVLPECQGQGIGSALMSACEEQMNMTCVRLTVRASNQVAIRLYQRLGYHVAERWHGYYQDGEDGVVMEKRRL